MLTIDVNNKEYKIKFGYKALAKSRVLADVSEMSNAMSNDENQTDMAAIGDILETLAKLLLAGLQKFHSTEFGCAYDTEKEVEKAISNVYDLLDDYFEQEDALAPLDLFIQLTNELMHNGFFKSLTAKAEATMEQMDATVVPQDHQKAVRKKN